MDNKDSIVERAGLATASNYQLKIFEAVETAVNQIIEGGTPTSLIIEAKPGSGKTTTGVAATRLIPHDISSIFVAFNKKIAEELGTRLPPSIPARTFHSQWLRQWGRRVRNRHKTDVKINKFKVQNAVEKYFGLSRFTRSKKPTASQIIERKKKREQAEDVIFLVEKAKLFGVVPYNYADAESVTGYEDNEYFWLHVMEYFNYEINPDQLDDTIGIAREILFDQLDNECEVDFADMLYLPAVKKVAGDRYQIVLIDEAQDMNGLQRYLLGQMVAPGGMIMAIGDSRQSIYAFRGADAESMEQIRLEFACQQYPLSISYRCPRRVVKVAYDIYPEIEAAPDAPEGSVEYPETWNIDQFKPGHLIICRNNAPTIDLAYRLIRHRIPAKVLGRDLGDGLIRLIQKLNVDDSLVELFDRLRVWRDHQIALIERKEPGDERSKEQIRDKYVCLTNLASSEEIIDVPALIRAIDELFTTRSDEKQAISPYRVTLSSIHKIKGAETDTVFILDAHLINPWWIQGDWQHVQEENLRFVAVTRAKNRLIFINSDCIRS